jgi:hypothetical protein
MRRRVIAAAAAALALLAVGIPAAADMAQPHVVSTNPVDYTPHVLDGEVRALALVGDTVVVGGDFSSVTDASGQTHYARHNLFAYQLRTGAVTAFAPAVDGTVLALATGGNGTVYAGGTFEHVDGAGERGLAQLDVADGRRVAGFAASINWGDVRSIVARGTAVYVGGSFSAINGVGRVALAKLDAASGTVDGGFDLHLTGAHLSRVKVEDLALTPDGRRLGVVGAFEQAAGQNRAQIMMVDVTGPAKPADWYTDVYTAPCRAGFETYLRGIDFDPTGAYAVVVTTGRMSGNGLMCDSVARFEVAGTGGHKPTWVNKTGGDSLYSVSATGSGIYVGGHQRWMDNPLGHESAGPGAVSRTGIADIDPHTGLATDWDPTRKPRGIGARALLATPVGLVVGSDTDNLGGEYHPRLGMLPL